MTRFLFALLLIALAGAAPARADCRRVGDAGFIRIDPAAAARLAEIGLDRAGIFASMADTSVPETMGCWAMRRAISTASSCRWGWRSGTSGRGASSRC
ncbi:MAG: hypothetical protein WDN44_04995 [Sphingomonas sp.]